jgi:hypothetical protein
LSTIDSEAPAFNRWSTNSFLPGREKSHTYVYLEFCTYNTISLVLSLLRCTCIYTLTMGKSTCSEMQCWFNKLSLIFKCFKYFCLLQISTDKQLSKWQPYNITVPLDLKVTKDTRLILNIIYVWKVNQTVLELDFRAVKFLFFPPRDLNPHHWYTAAPFA